MGIGFISAFEIFFKKNSIQRSLANKELDSDSTFSRYVTLYNGFKFFFKRQENFEDATDKKKPVLIFVKNTQH